MKLDTTNWHYFAIGGPDGIFNLKKGYYNKKPEHTIVGTIPFIGATENNNGVTEYYSIDDIKRTHKDGSDTPDDISKKMFRGNCITVTNNGSVGHAYYQKDAFTCSHDVNPLYLKERELNEYIALFLCAVIERDRYRWAYGRKWRPERMERSMVKLPVNPDGKPDYDYMENYIKAVRYKKITTHIATHEVPLLLNGWNEFKLSDLFLISVSTDANLQKSNPGTTPYVSSTAENNGISGYVDSEASQNGNVLTIARNGSVGSTFYQGKPFCASPDDVRILTPKFPLTVYTALFIKTILEREKFRYAYGRKLGTARLKDMIIKLPATTNGDLDLVYMENYIKSLPYSDRI